MNRSPQDETVRQLKLLNAQLNPLPTLFRAALWIVGGFVGFCLLIRFFQP